MLLAEAVAALLPRASERYLDGSFGGGGHSAALLATSAPDGRVLALDRDPAAIERGATLAAEWGSRLVLRQAASPIWRRWRPVGFAPLDGLLLDLGVSSQLVDQAERGFSFQADGPLDVRMDPTSGEPSSVLVNELPEEELADLIYQYGEERASRRIARSIVQARARARRETTGDLVRAIIAAIGRPPGGLRGDADLFPGVAYRRQRRAWRAGAGAGRRVGGRAAGRTDRRHRFHSLEDRIVKQFFRREATDCLCPPSMPVCQCDHKARLRIITKRPVTPTDAEAAVNPRSRGAKDARGRAHCRGA